jgi:putative membrane protein
MEQPRDSQRLLVIWGAMLGGVGIALLLAMSLASWSLAPAPGTTPPGTALNPFSQVITFLAWLLVISGISLLGLWLGRKLWPAIIAPAGHVSAEAVHAAQLRYARGEISRDEYQRIREDLLLEGSAGKQAPRVEHAPERSRVPA